MRQLALDAAYPAHPERFSHGAPRVATPGTRDSLLTAVSKHDVIIVGGGIADWEQRIHRESARW